MEQILKSALDANHPSYSTAHETRKRHYHNEHCPCNKHETEVDRICNCGSDLTRPPEFQISCFVFATTENHSHVTSKKILSLKKKVTEVFYPFNEPYSSLRFNYNKRYNIYPVAVVRAHEIDDIVSTINFCRKTGIPIRARGGTHSYQPASLVNFGVVVDQRPRNKIVEIDCEHRMATIQAGAVLGPVIDELAKENLFIPFGTCATNGLAGLSLGGGIGFFLREYGLTLDSLLDMKVVLSDGCIVHSNYDENSDLFGALRGAGGGNYGIVTDFTFKIRKADWVTIFIMNFDFKDTKPVFKVWQNWAPFTDTKLTSELNIHNRFQPVNVTGQLLPGKSPKADQKLLFKLLQPLIDLGLQKEFSIKTVSLKEAAEFFGEGSYARPPFFYNQSFFNFRPLPDEAIDIIIHFMGLLREEQSFHKTECDALGGNFSKIPSDATAFPSRNAIHWFQFTSLWDTEDQEKENVAWLNSYYGALKPFFPENRKYVNALDYNVSRDSALHSYYDGNLPRLINIKKIYDPTNFFNFEQSIPV
ncbi:MAG: FAD-binding oxidoreductase [Satyrvirus sp.]|uniref:FAD-binding oxidoreductase n=1 Tax=Satyrvirus sp. TaxID=2487771 RepID=A0A3G5ADI3_9VIRU|nr:MAG: FAD-binding oxidoreductase [Satyrvirus sp.]